MNLTRFTNYSLRVLQFAALHPDRLCRIDEVADAHGIARTYIVQATHELGKLDLLVTIRGRHGGFRLARPAETITVGEVVRKTEIHLCLVECFSPETSACPLIGACHLSNVLKRALRAFLEVLDATTIADIARNRDDLLTRLAGAPTAEGAQTDASSGAAV